MNSVRAAVSRFTHWAYLTFRAPETTRLLDSLRAGARLSPSAVETLQRRKIEELLLHAGRTVPYYSRLFAETGYDPTAPFHPAAFRRLPILDKPTIRANFTSLQSTRPSPGRYYNTSGGSTGEPVRLVQDIHYRRRAAAVAYYFYEQMGVRYWDPCVVLWGSKRDILEGTVDWWARFGNWVKGREFLNSFHMTEEDMRSFVNQINEHRPSYVLAYVQSIFELARFAQRHGIEVSSPGAIMTSAGTLYEPMRETIQQTFGCGVFDRYGSREVGDMAGECAQHKGLHVSALTHYIEVVNLQGEPAQPGEMGQILVTSLINRSMPLIRYRIGDMAIPGDGPCPCGSGYPVLKKVIGRSTDFFVTPAGELVYGGYFTHLFFYKDYVTRFQVIQDAIDRIRVLVQPSGEGAERAFERDIPELERQMRAALGHQVAIAFSAVRELEPSPSGKFVYAISHVPH